MIFLVLLVVAVLLTSGLCSMTEAAILSVSLMRARILYEKNRKGARNLLFIKENIHSAVATIVILNNAVNIIGAIFVGQMVAHTFGNKFLGVFSAVMTFAIIIISEVIPKTIGEHYKIPVALASSRTLRVLMWILRPLVKTISAAIKPFSGKRRKPWVTEEEIKILAKLGRDMGTVEVDEERLINRVFKLNDLTARQMMKPINRMYVLDGNKTVLEEKRSIIDSPYSRIAVYEKNPSNVTGICQQRALLKEVANDNYNTVIKSVMSKPIFVSEEEKADSLLEKFQLYHQHLFIVRNAHGENIGIITMEDVLEELFGEIYDEKDTSIIGKE